MRGLTPVLPLVLALAACRGDFERMREQPRYERYGASDMFEDGKVMQHAPPGTVALEAEGPPPRIDMAAMRAGQQAFTVYCAACHGVLGTGGTPVAAHMPLRTPPSLHDPRIVTMTDGALYDVVTNGYGFMPAYAPQLAVDERWAVVAYLRALQRSQRVALDALPAGLQPEARAALEGAP